MPRGRDAEATFRAWADELTARAKTPGARLSYEGATPFGRDAVRRWRLGNGLIPQVSMFSR